MARREVREKWHATKGMTNEVQLEGGFTEAPKKQLQERNERR